MPSMYDVSPEQLINETASQLKEMKELTPPVWAVLVKTGSHKQRPPADPQWWFHRSASILRKIRMNGPIGVQKLRRAYGGRKNRGMRPEKFVIGSGNIIRKSLQQLEQAGLAKQVEVKGRKGRVVTPKGMQLLDKAAQSILSKTEKSSVVPQLDKESVKLKQKPHEEIVETLMKNRTRNPRPQRGNRRGGHRRGGFRR